MQTITIEIKVPDGVAVRVAQAATPDNAPSASDPAHDYFHNFLSGNGRRIYRAAAQVEGENGPRYTHDDIAAKADLEYGSAKSMHRSTGRSAKRWRRERGGTEPIRLVKLDYEWDGVENGYRWQYRLPEGVAHLIEGW